MAIITLPTTLPIGAGSGFGQRRFDLLAQSDSTGAQQTRLLGPPRWTLALQPPDPMRVDEAGQWAALAASLRGRVNVLWAFDPARRAPQGTLRGTLTLAAAAAIGAAALSVTGGAGQAGKTLRAGDLLQLGSGLGTSQLVMVLADATADGSGVVALSVEPPLRTAFSAGAAVTWDTPRAHFRLQSDALAWTYRGGGLLASGLAMDFTETWG